MKKKIFMTFTLLFMSLKGLATHIRELNILSPNDKFNSFIQFRLRNFEKKKVSEDLLFDLREQFTKAASSNGYYSAQIDSLKISPEGKIEVVASQVVQFDFYFDGVNPLNSPDLSRELDLPNFHTQSSSPQFEILGKLKNFYLKRGYSRVEAYFEVQEKNEFHKIVTFKITEGPKVKIRSIRFLGEYSLGEKYYKDLLFETAPESLQKKIYVRSDVESAVEGLKMALISEGYLKSQVYLNSVSFSNDFQLADINILIFEGPQTHLRSIQFNGNQKIQSEELLKLISHRLNQPLDLAQIEKDLKSIENFYRNIGYLDMRYTQSLKEMIEFDNDASSANLLIQIEEGDKILVGRIKIEGNDFTKNYVIHRELTFKEGEILTQKGINQSQDQLYLTGLFNSVRIIWDQIDETTSARIVRVVVEEREPGVFMLGSGVHNERGLTLRGYLGASYNNLLGTRRALSARVEGQYNLQFIPFLEQSFQLLYLEPYLFSTRISGRVGLNRSYFITDFNNQVASEANRTQYIIDYPVNSKFIVSWQLLDITTFRDFLITSREETNLVEIGSTLLRLTWDMRDHPFTANSGHLTTLQWEYAHPRLLSSPWVQFYKTIAQHTHHITVWKEYINIAIHGRWGEIRHDQGFSIPYDKVGFFLGGQNTMRGFSLNEVFPNTNDLGGTNFRLKGRATMELIRGEVRFATGFENIFVGLFTDHGRLAFDGFSYDSGWRRTFGLSIRYATPIGHIAVEYGWKTPPEPDRGESPGALHLAIGSF